MWNTKSDGTGDSYGSEFYNSLIIGSADVILYAQWERNISNDFTDGNFKQAVWEWLGNPEGSTPGDFSEGDLDRASLMYGYLDISNRGIANLNGFEYFQNTDLRFFNCGGNQITNMPDLPANLELFACNDNKLIALPTLPDSLMGLASSNNQLFSLPALPAGLEILICSNNWLGNLPTLPEQLTTLICSNNQLAFLPILPESLAEIDFSFNYIQDVSRPDIVKISEDESNIIVVYPQYKLAGRQKELQLNSGDAYSLVNELYILQYDGTDWIETETAVDPSWIRFSSSDQAVAMTSDKGIITGFGSGTCQINALCGNNDTEYTKVTFTMTIFPREGGTTDDSKVTSSLTLGQVAEAIEKAEEGEDTVVCVEITLSPSTDVNSVEILMPRAAVSLLAESKADTFMVSTPVSSITFSHSAIATISKEAMGEIKITASRVEASTLSDEARQAVGGRQVYQFSVTSTGKTISQFGGKVTVSVPYTPKAGEDLGAIIIYYIDAEGNLEIIANCAYNSITGMVTFQTNHFSYFAVGYNKLVFKDVTASAWYSKAVNFVAARGITAGIGNGKFDPNAKITRGQFVVMVMKAYGLAPEENPLNNFADAGDTYYTGYLAAAKRLGISGGVGNNMYAPEKEITRQDMFTLLYNTLKLVDELPIDTAGKALKDYNDADQIATWARTAMTLFVKTGIINGNEGNLNPTDTTSRAQMVQVLYNLLSK